MQLFHFDFQSNPTAENKLQTPSFIVVPGHREFMEFHLYTDLQIPAFSSPLLMSSRGKSFEEISSMHILYLFRSMHTSDFFRLSEVLTVSRITPVHRFTLLLLSGFLIKSYIHKVQSFLILTEFILFCQIILSTYETEFFDQDHKFPLPKAIANII